MTEKWDKIPRRIDNSSEKQNKKEKCEIKAPIGDHIGKIERSTPPSTKITAGEMKEMKRNGQHRRQVYNRLLRY